MPEPSIGGGGNCLFPISRKQPLTEHCHDKPCVAYYIAAPHPARVGTKAVQPFQAELLHHQWSTLACACIEIKDGSNGADIAVYVQHPPMPAYPFLLFRCRHSYQEQVRIGIVDSRDHACAVLFRELFPERRAVSDDVKPGIFSCHPFADSGKDMFRGAHEHHCLALPFIFFCGRVQLLHLIHEHVPPRHALLRRIGITDKACRHYYADTVRHQIIATHKRLCKLFIFLCADIGICVYGINQYLSCGNLSQIRPAANKIKFS